jgi:glutamate carboxypeptidase
MKKTIYLIAFLLIASHFSVNADDETERAIVAQINQQIPLAFAELEEVVNINSGTMNFAGVKQVGTIFRQQFDELGFTTEWIEGESFGRAGHLVASYGKTGPKLLLIGHLDTVFAKDDPFQEFKKLDSTHIAGPGITDMKGGNVIMVNVLRALKILGILDRVSVRVVLTGDEERSGKPLSASKLAIVDAAKWADIALGFEDGDGDIQTAVIARRGAISWTLEVSGKPAHSSQIFRDDIGDGAIYETARILNEFRLQLTQFDNLTFNPGLILGGTSLNYDATVAGGQAMGKDNVIAQKAMVTGDIRALSPQQLAKSKQIMQQIVSDNLAHTSAVITFAEGYPPMAPTEANRQLLQQYSRVSQSLGYGPVRAVDPRRAGAADISFAANHVEMALDGLGLMGTGGHTKDEVADMMSLAQNAHKAAILIYRLSRK